MDMYEVLPTIKSAMIYILQHAPCWFWYIIFAIILIGAVGTCGSSEGNAVLTSCALLTITFLLVFWVVSGTPAIHVNLGFRVFTLFGHV